VRYFKLTLIPVALVVAMMFSTTGVASATNAHQDHQGACARSTTSIREGVEDLTFNGVVGQFANAIGLQGFNGSFKFQMEHRLVIARVKKSVTAANHGCDGSGGVFGAGPRTLVKGEEVAAKLPPNLSAEELCSGPNPNCEEVTFTVRAVFPASCWNLNEATIELVVFVHKHKKPKSKSVRVCKVAIIEATGVIIQPIPTGIFRMKFTAKGYKSKTVTINNPCETVGNYRAGTKLCAKELTPLGNDQWTLVNPEQCQTVSKKGNTFTFKNKEKSTPVPPAVSPPGKPEVPSIKAKCSNIVVGGNGNEQGGNCNTCVGTNVCNENHEPPKPPEVCVPPKEGTPPNCVEPPSHWTEISCTGFEEISGRGSFLVDCAVSDDNGAPISLEAYANDGNSRVSGINCFSNGGTQTCPSGGTFEFRVSGKNEGSSILESSITAVASANGVSAAFISDPFPVDPAEGGF
jgi:hypothetical protein